MLLLWPCNFEEINPLHAKNRLFPDLPQRVDQKYHN